MSLGPHALEIPEAGGMSEVLQLDWHVRGQHVGGQR